MASYSAKTLASVDSMRATVHIMDSRVMLGVDTEGFIQGLYYGITRVLK